MTILALDLGQNLGWAAVFSADDVVHGTVEFKPGRFEGGGMVWLRFRKWLNVMHEEHGPIEAIYFEEVMGLRGQNAARVFGGFLATLTSWCEAKGVPYSGIPVGTIKKHATGRGNCDKKAMIEAARKRGYEPETDNDADALALAFCVMDEMSPA